MKDNVKVAIIIYKTNDSMCNRLLESLKRLEVQYNIFVDVVVIENAASRAQAYNEAMKSSDAKYKIYVDDSGVIVHPNIISKILQVFIYKPNVGLIGLYGSEMPLNGVFSASEVRYGIYGRLVTENEAKLTKGKNPLFLQKVHCIDGAFMATSADIEWDEDADEEFLAAAQCCRFRENDIEIGVLIYDGLWCAFGREISYSEHKINDVARQIFFKKYKNVIQPLVSILITTYNQPGFFKQALESALVQDYQNVEIIIGDDSTNTETKELMQKYLNKYDNIRYYYHGGPLGGLGRENLKFVLNRASGEYIDYLFHDDLLLPNKISSMMKYYAKDLSEEIGIVTSVRNAIDANGNMLGRLSPWQPDKDEVLSARQIARGILEWHNNYIGELTTVLLRKKLFKTKKGDFAVGVFAGLRDRAHGDIGTFLECARLGKKCVFMKEVLSIYRFSDTQNTHNRTIIAQAVMEWLNYIVLSWHENIFIDDVADLHNLYAVWQRLATGLVKGFLELAEEERTDDEKLCIKAVEAAQHKDYALLRALSVESIKSYDDSDEAKEKFV